MRHLLTIFHAFRILGTIKKLYYYLRTMTLIERGLLGISYHVRKLIHTGTRERGAAMARFVRGRVHWASGIQRRYR